MWCEVQEGDEGLEELLLRTEEGAEKGRVTGFPNIKEGTSAYHKSGGYYEEWPSCL